VPIQRISELRTPEAVASAAAAIAWSSFSKDPEHLAALARRFVSEPDKALYAELLEERILALVAVEGAGGETVTIAQIGVDPLCRRRGMGRRLVEHLSTVYCGAKLQAETDRDAVGFYRELGFSVESLGYKHPGVERFLCTLAPGTSGAAGCREVPSVATLKKRRGQA
jgi:ribosomal protein S18 acetylase RimI-like enzyme